MMISGTTRTGLAHNVGRVELVVMILFGIGCLAAVLTLPAVAWIQLLPVAPDWMRTALLTGAIVPIGLGLVFAVVQGARRVKRLRHSVRNDIGQE